MSVRFLSLTNNSVCLGRGYRKMVENPLHNSLQNERYIHSKYSECENCNGMGRAGPRNFTLVLRNGAEHKIERKCSKIQYTYIEHNSFLQFVIKIKIGWESESAPRDQPLISGKKSQIGNLIY